MAYLSEKLDRTCNALRKVRFFVILCNIGIFQAFYAQKTFAETIDSPILGKNFGEVIQNIADQARNAALIIAPVFIVIAGLQFLFAGESEQKISQAKKTLWWTLIGTAIVVGADVLVSAVVNTVQGL